MSVARNVSLVLAVSLALTTVGLGQETRPYIGVQLDPAPLPELLAKHLRLKPEQGVRIRNVSVGSPADEVGLERDDILIGFQGQEITSADALVDAIGGEAVGATVSLEIVHLGARKTLELELKPIDEHPEWKYAAEPEIITSWRPGRFFRIGPNGERWTEVPWDNFDLEVKKFFQERHTTHHATDGEEHTITIEGNPTDESTRVIVETESAEYTATLGEIDTLPEKYRAAAREALQSARRSSRQRLRLPRPALPEPPNPDLYRRYFENLTVPRPDLDRWSDGPQRMLERMQEQMERMQERMERLEERYRKLQGNPPEKPRDSDTSSSPAGDTHPARSEDQQTV